jgi:hypothetical protein
MLYFVLERSLLLSYCELSVYCWMLQYNTIQFIDARRITRKGNYYNLTIHFPRYVLISSKPIQSSF